MPRVGVSGRRWRMTRMMAVLVLLAAFPRDLPDRGDGTFAMGVPLQIPGLGSAIALASSDFNRDATLDLALIYDYSSGVILSQDSNDRNHWSKRAFKAESPHPSALRSADFDGDGDD